MERMKYLITICQGGQQRLHLILELEKEKDPKHPDCRYKYIVVRYVYTAGWMSFKDFILNICSLRNEDFSRDARFRVNSAISDLYAADARYHQD